MNTTAPEQLLQEYSDEEVREAFKLLKEFKKKKVRAFVKSPIVTKTLQKMPQL